MTRIIRAKGPKAGFTLIELLVVMVISVIVLYGAFSFFERQQLVFNQQAAQAEKQANLRIALYYLSKDIALAGFTGTPWGVEHAISAANKALISTPIRPIKHLQVSSDPELTGSEYALDNLNGDALDAIEIWANFSENLGSGRGRTQLVNPVNAGSTTLNGNTVDGLFILQVWDDSSNSYQTVSPIGVVIGAYKEGVGDYLPVTSVNSGSNVISVASGALNNYMGGVTDSMAPVFKRRYFVREECDGPRCDRWLIRRDYYAAGVTIDHRMAQGIEDFQVFYDLTDPVTGAFLVDFDPDDLTADFDPCWVTAVTIKVQAVVRIKDMPKPLITNMSRKIVMMNIGTENGLNNCTCAVGDPDCTAFAGP